MRLIALVVSALLLLGSAPSHATVTMTADQAARHYVKTVCKLDWKIAEFNASEFASLGEARAGARRLARAYDLAAGRMVEAPAAWPARPKVRRPVDRLVRAMVRTYAELARAAAARSLPGYVRAVRGAAREGRALKPQIRTLNRRFGLYASTDRNCADLGFW